MQLALCYGAYISLVQLVRAKRMLMPLLPAELHDLPSDSSEAFPGYGTISATPSAGSARSLKSTNSAAELKALEPVYLSRTKVVYNDSKGLVAFVFSLFGQHRLPNKHEQVFVHFGAHGPQMYMLFIKMSLLLSMVILTATVTILWSAMVTVSPLVPWLLFIPAGATFALVPTLLDAYTWCCSVENFKQKGIMIEVLRRQKHEKIVEIVRSLTMLSFFVDQIEMMRELTAENRRDSAPESTEQRWKVRSL